MSLIEIKKLSIPGLYKFYMNHVSMHQDSIYFHDNGPSVYTCKTGLTNDKRQDSIALRNITNVVHVFPARPTEKPVRTIKFLAVNQDSRFQLTFANLRYRTMYWINGYLMMHNAFAKEFYDKDGKLLYQTYLSGPGFFSRTNTETYLNTQFGTYTHVPLQNLTNTLLVPIYPLSSKCGTFYQLSRNDQSEYGEMQAKLSDTTYWTTPYPLLGKFRIPNNFHPCDTLTQNVACLDTAGWQNAGFMGTIHPRAAEYYYQGKIIARDLDLSRRVEPFTVDPLRHLIFGGDGLSANIQVYDTNNRILRSFGTRGKYIKLSDTIVYFQRSWLEAEAKIHGGGSTRSRKLSKHLAKYKTKASYESFEYGLMFMDTLRNHLYRQYEIPMPINIDSLYHAKENNPDSFEFPCKPTFLQIYDLSDNDRLIFDGPVPAPFKVLDVDAAGYLWAIAGQEDEKLVIRKYRIVRE